MRRSAIYRLRLTALASLLFALFPQSTPPATAFDQGSVSPRPTSFSMLAAFEFTTVFTSRTSPTYTTGNNTVLSNGTYWYWRQNLSFGFSPDSTVNIDATRRYDICASTHDVSCSPGSSTSRMSWRIDNSNIMAGGRAGATIDITSGNASMYCFYSNATTKPSYFPSGIARNVLYSTITSGGWSLAGEKYYRATSYPDPTFHYMFGKARSGGQYAKYLLCGAADPNQSNVVSFTPTEVTTSSRTLTYNLVFTEAVTGLASNDFSLSGTGSSSCSIGSPTGSGTTYQVVLTGCSTGTVILTLAANSVTGATTGPPSSFAATTVTISGISGTVTASSTNVTFGSATSSSFTTSGLPSGCTVSSITYTYSGSGTTTYGPSTTAPTNAGAYSVVGSSAVTSGCATTPTITYSSSTFTISKASARITPTSTTVEYGSAASYPITITSGATTLSSGSIAGYSAPTCSASTYSVTSSAASTHTIACTGGSSTNYTFTTSDTATLTVTQAPLTISPVNQSVTYGAARPTYSFGVSGWKNSQSAANAAGYVAPTCTSSYSETSVVTTSPAITCSGGAATNYSFTYQSAAVTINKAGTLRITPASLSANFGSSYTPTYTTFGLVGSRIASVTPSYTGAGATSYGPSATPPTAIGTYTFSLTPVFDTPGTTNNYTAVTIDTATLTIARASLGITASSFTIIYGDTNPVTSTSATFSGLATTDSITSVTITYSGSGSTSYGPSTTAPTDVGTYTLSASAPVFSVGSTGSASTYTITYSPGLLTISRAVLTVTGASATVTYGDARPNLTPTITGWKYSDSAANASGFSAGSCSTNYSVTTNVSASPVSTSCSGYLARNYSFSYVNGAITIQRKALSISGTTISSRVFNSNRTAGTVVPGTLSGLMNGERLTVTGVGSEYSAENPGDYTSTVTYTLGNDPSGDGIADNYTLASQSGISGTITPIAVGFNLTSTLGLSDVFTASFGNKVNPVTLTATVNEVGSVGFQYSTNGGTTWTSVTGCTAVAVVISGGNGAANCNFNSPTDGAITFRANFTPTDVSKESRSASLDTRIVPRPVVSSFNSSSGSAINSATRGTTIAIMGSNFLGVTSISFNGSAASMTGVRATATRIIVTVPAGATTGLVKVTTLYGGESVGISLTIP